MILRQALVSDIKQMHEVRMAVRENVLPDPLLISEKEYEEFLTVHGKGWLCEADDQVVGFAIVDMAKNNIWALFVTPGYKGRGIGKQLHQEMLNWYFDQTKQKVWLGTSPGTRAETFYKNAGWKEAGKHKNGEIHFELTFEDWNT